MLTSITPIIVLSFSASIIYASALIFYRLLLHPLVKYPGPKIAASTAWYQFYFDVIQRPGGQYMWEILRLHEIYGPIVRIGPNELHVNDPEWYEKLHCSGSAIRDKPPFAAKYFGTLLAVFGTVDHETHKIRKGPVLSYFSKKNIRSFEETLKTHVENLSGKFSLSLRTGAFVDLRLSYIAFTTDLLYLYGFGEDLGLRNDSKKALNWLRTIHAVAGITPIARQIPDVIPWLLQLSPRIVRFIYPSLIPMLRLHQDMKKQAVNVLKGTVKNTGHLGFAPDDVGQRSTVFQAILQSDLPSKEKSADRLAQDAFVLMGAGGDTPARTLVAGTCYLLANPSCLSKLHEELDRAIPDPCQIPTLQALEELPYLTAVIKESSRFLGLITSRTPLISPEMPLQFRQWMIPAGTPVSMTIHHILHDPNVFPSPHEFQPSRWLAVNNKSLSRFYVPFGRGHRMCVGQSFALAEMYLAFATIFRRFELRLEGTVWDRDVKVVRDCFVAETMPDTKGVRVKVMGKRV